MAEKKSIYISARMERVLGDIESEGLSGRINSIADRYGLIVNAVMQSALSRLDDNNLRQIRAACWSWATVTEPAEILLGGIAAEVADAAEPDGDLAGENVSDTLALLATMTVAEELALIEWLEQQRK